MNRAMRPLWIGFGVFLFSFLGMAVFLIAPWSRPVAGDGWQARLPIPTLPPKATTEGPWSLIEAVGSARFRVGLMPFRGDSVDEMVRTVHEFHPRPVERVSLTSVPGVFLLSGSKKYWRATLLFPVEGRLFRAEALEDHGNAADPLFRVSSMAASIGVGSGGAPALAMDPEELDHLLRPLISRHLVGTWTVFRWMIPFLALLLGFSLTIIRLAGRLPTRPPGAPVPYRAEAYVPLDIHRGRFVRRKTIGALVLDSQGLHISSLGRPILEVPQRELGMVQEIRQGDPSSGYEVVRGPIRVRFHPKDPAAWAPFFHP